MQTDNPVKYKYMHAKEKKYSCNKSLQAIFTDEYRMTKNSRHTPTTSTHTHFKKHKGQTELLLYAFISNTTSYLND